MVSSNRTRVPISLLFDYLVVPRYYEQSDYYPGSMSEAEDIATSVLSCIMGDEYDYALRIGLEEALRNAYEHGNNMDSDKRIRVCWTDKPSIIVMDQGNTIRRDYYDYLKHFNHSNDGIPYYSYIGVDRPRGNYGMGTMLIHKPYNAQYYRGELGGLAVLLEPRAFLE